jgi:predicted enzyme related to lactoylglutathione lyase
VDPIFAVSDVARSKDHYERMGFTISEHDATHALARRGTLTIRLVRADDPTIGSTSSIYLHVDDADALAEAWRLAGLEVVGPHDIGDGDLQGSHRDPDGNLVCFGSPARATHDA